MPVVAGKSVSVEEVQEFIDKREESKNKSKKITEKRARPTGLKTTKKNDKIKKKKTNNSVCDIQKLRDLQEKQENAILDTNQKAMNKIEDEDVENIQNALNIRSYKEKENRECVEKDQVTASAQGEETYIVE